MKKGIVVLLIAVLVAGFAFAGFSGVAEVDFGVDLDAKTWGFTNYRYGKYTFKFEFDTTSVPVGAEHTTDVWAELEGSATAYINLTGYYLDSSTKDATNTYYYASISKANIHIGEDLTIGILSAGTAVDFASSYYKNTFVGTSTYYDYINWTATKESSYKYYNFAFDTLGGGSCLISASVVVPGVEITFKDWYGGFGAEGDWSDEDNVKYSFFGHIATPEFKFAEDAVTVQAGAYGVLDESDSYLGGGFMAAYASDKASADVGVDLAYNDETFLFEAAANAELNFVENLPITLNVYATPGQLADNELSARYSSKKSAYPLNYELIGYTDETIKLDAQVAVEYALSVNDDITVDLEASVNATDILLEDAREIAVYAGEGTTIDAFTVELSQSYAIVAKVLALTFDVSYAAEKFVAYASLETDFQFADSDADTITSIPFSCGISSEAIVEGAELALAYADADFADFENNKGAITASCSIAF